MECFHIYCIWFNLCLKAEAFTLVVNMSILTLLINNKITGIELHTWTIRNHIHRNTRGLIVSNCNRSPTAFRVIVSHIIVVISASVLQLLEVCKKYRGNIEKVYEKYIAERLAGKDVDPARIFVTTSNAPSPELAQRLEDTVRKAVPDVQEVLFTRTGCTVTSHCGPGTMGVLFLEK